MGPFILLYEGARNVVAILVQTDKGVASSRRTAPLSWAQP
jgi:hypothetical protein